MNILLTGATGFLGKKLMQHLCGINHVVTLGRKNTHILCDLERNVPKLQHFDIVLHSAGKAHFIPTTNFERQEFFNVNVTGTENLLKGLKLSSFQPTRFVFISSVAVYGASEGELISEEMQLNATDPYGLSKCKAEEVVQDWCFRNGVICTILRLPLIAGAAAPGNLGAMVKSIQRGYYFNIAGGSARRSMVLADDVAKFIIPAAMAGGIYNLTDGYHPSFAELSNCIALQLKKTTPSNMPRWLATGLAKVGDILGDRFPFDSYRMLKITKDLTFDDSKARDAFGWNPQPVLKALNIM